MMSGSAKMLIKLFQDVTKLQTGEHVSFFCSFIITLNLINLLLLSSRSIAHPELGLCAIAHMASIYYEAKLCNNAIDR